MEKMQPMLFTTLKNYSKEQFTKDLIAGVIVAIIALPLSIALALASGVGPEQGIFTAIIAGFLISALGAYGVVRFFPRFGKVLTRVLITTYMFPPIMLAVHARGICISKISLCVR